MRHDEVAKRFANGATKGKGCNVFIDGDTIYSYGYHFPIARRVREGGGEGYEGRVVAYLFNSDSYSSSTSKHQSYVRGALTGGETLHVSGCNMENIPQQIEGNRLGIETVAVKIKKARTLESIEMHTRTWRWLREQNELLAGLITQIEMERARRDNPPEPSTDDEHEDEQEMESDE